MAESITRFGAVDSNFSSTIASMEGRLGGFANSVNNVGVQTGALPAAFARVAVGVAAFAASVAGAIVGIQTFRTALDFIEKLENLKAQTGASAAALIQLQRAFELTGSSADKVGPAINKVQEIIAKAGEGSPKAIEQLSKLGLTFDQLKNLSPEQQLEAMMKAIAGIPDPATRAEAAMAIFGTRLGRELLPMIRDFDAAMQSANATLGSFPEIVERYGPAMERFSNAIDALKQKPQEFAVGVVGPMSVLLGNLAQRFAEFDAAALGERIGIALNNILVEMLVWAERVYKILSGIWEGLQPAAQPVFDAIAQAFYQLSETVRPYIERIGEFFNNIDYTAIGQKIGEQFALALNVAKGLWADPVAIFGLYGDYLNFTFRQAGDTFLSVFVTAVEVIGRAWAGIMSPAFFEGIAKIFIGAIIMGVGVINERFLATIEGVIRFFSELWNSVTTKSVGDLASQLWEMIKGFAKSFLDALTSPARLISGALGSALMETTANAAKRFQTDFDSAHGGIIAKARQGMDGMAREGAKTMTEGFNQATGALMNGVKSAVTETQGFKSNIFGSVEAGEQLRQKAEAIAENGRDYFNNVSAAGGHIKEAKLDVTGTGGISPALEANANALNQTADKTQTASGEITTAFDNVAKSGEATGKSVQDAGTSFQKQAVEAGRDFASEVTKAMRGLTDSMRGFATESTLQKAVSSLERLERKLPQPVLV